MSRYNAIYGAVAKAFFGGKITKRNERRAGLLAQEFQRLDLPPCAVAIRKAEFERRWPKIVCTPEAMAKHVGVMIPPSSLDKFARLLEAEKSKAVECVGMTKAERWEHFLARHHTVQRQALREAWRDYLIAIGRTPPPWLIPEDLHQLDLNFA